MGVGKGLADRNLAPRAATAERKAAGSHVWSVENGFTTLGQRVDQTDGWLWEPRNIEGHLDCDAGLDSRHSRNFCQIVAHGVRRALHPGKYVGEPMALVVSVAC